MFLNKFNKKLIYIIFLFHCFISNISLKIGNINHEFKNENKTIGVIGLDHSQNVGNNLLKYAMFVELSELGFTPFFVGKRYKKHNISFIEKYINIRLIKNFSEIKQNDFDILMVNSDQTWRKYDSYFYDIALLKFAENWKIKKFVYGASSGSDDWSLSKEDEKIAKHLLSNFTGLSVREKSLQKWIKRHLGLKVQFVLDPTLLINKKYYLNLINNYKSNIINKNNHNFIFAYILNHKGSSKIFKYMSYIEKKLNTNVYYITMNNENQVKEFLYGIYNCKAVITNSYHGTIFSIIFNKPFITLAYQGYKQCRFKNLIGIFNIKNRIFDYTSFPSFSLLYQPLRIDKNKLISLKRTSINYLKKNLVFP